MEFNKNDIEYYLVNKSFKELSEEELKIVQGAVANEAEYNELRNLLLVMQEVPSEELLMPDASIKQSLVAEFEKVNSAKVVPIKKEEKTKQRKGIFWLSIAASVALVIGLFLSKDALFPKNETQIAQLDSKDTPTQEEDFDLTREKTEVEEITAESNETEIVQNQKATDKDEAKQSSVLVLSPSNIKVKDKSVKFRPSSTSEGKSAASKFGFDTKSADDLLLIDLEMEEEFIENEAREIYDVAEVSDFYESSSGAVRLEEDNKLMNEITTSVSLKDDEDLIDLLYTAL